MSSRIQGLKSVVTQVRQAHGQPKWVESRRSIPIDSTYKVIRELLLKPKHKRYVVDMEQGSVISVKAMYVCHIVGGAIGLGILGIGNSFLGYIVNHSEFKKKVKELEMVDEALEKQSKEMRREFLSFSKIL